MVTIRPATLADADDVVRINVRAWQHAYPGIVPEDVLGDLDRRIDERVRRVRDRWSAPGPARFHTVLAVAGPGPDRQRSIGYVTYGPYRDGPDGDRLDPAVGEVLAIYDGRHGFAADGARDTFRVRRHAGTPVDLPEVRYARPVP
jgi:hypothetical protein